MDKKIEPNILAKLEFYPTNKGGRQTPISHWRFGCLFVYEGEVFDCFLILSEGEQLNPSDTVILPIKFLNPQIVMPILKVGSSFKLRELRVIASGEITEIYSNSMIVP